MFDVPPRQPMYACKDCGRQATKEQVFSAAEKCKDLSAMMQGLTPWQCTRCRLQQVSHATPPTYQTPIQLASTEDLIKELFSRFPHAIVAFRSIPVEGVNESMEGQYQHGDYRMCQGLASGIIGKIERDIVASVDRGRSREEQEEL